jgi:hypothetical protein
VLPSPSSSTLARRSLLSTRRGRVHHGHKQQLRAVGFPLLCSLSVPTEDVITISSSRCPRSATFRATAVTGAPRRRRCRGLGRRRTWPGHLGPSRAKPRAPVGAPGDGDSSTPLQRRRCGLPPTNRELRRTSSVQFA